MDLSESPAEAEYRHELRSWFSAQLPPGWGADEPGVPREDPDFLRSWSRRLHAAGYAGITWPAEHGGGGRSYTHEAIYREESARAEAPEHIGVIGLGMVGPTLIAHGTIAQQATYLPGILTGDVVFCQGFSETEAGSDLAALRTRAEVHADGFTVTGHKVWSSYAHLADHCLLLVRTDPMSAGHKGLTCLLLDLSAPGVVVRPIRQLTGAAQFNEIILDDVRIAADAVVGAIGDGWRVAMTTLSHERGVLGFTLAARLDAMFSRLVATARTTGAAADPVLRDRLAQLHVDVQALRYTNYRAADGLTRGAQPGPENSVAKLFWADVNQRLTALALEMLGPDARVGRDGYWHGYWQYEQLRSRGNSIEGGTSEILRSVLAERVVGLPRSR
jgi:alkylation response protein AidB-like acyl-CoA dehydrogenase